MRMYLVDKEEDNKTLLKDILKFGGIALLLFGIVWICSLIKRMIIRRFKKRESTEVPNIKEQPIDEEEVAK